jgi:Cu+-exporting ATPase
LLAQSVPMVAQAHRSHAPTQRLADQASGWFAPLVVGAAIAAFIAWAIWGLETRYAYDLVATVSVLCPCALGLATPMPIWSEPARAQSAVLIEDAEALDVILQEVVHSV